MTNDRKVKRNSSALVIIVLSILVIAGILFLTTNVTFWFKRSIHEDAKRYATRHCLVFYPDSKDGKDKAKQMCKGIKDDRVYDYSLVPFGDYYLVNYGSDIKYFVDKQYNVISVNNISDFGKRIISDYLRYTLKKTDFDKYYNVDYINKTSAENINFDEITYDFTDEYLTCHFPTYEIDVNVPLKYMQEEIGMNFGYQNELYSKPVYIDPNHPVICLTFDDGPQLWYDYNESSSVMIQNILHKYDVSATFYVVGEALTERDAWTDYEVYSFIKESIFNGNEYGSHTHYHDDLEELGATELVKTINEPAKVLYDLVGYKMKTYRPPYGYFNSYVLSNQPMPAILWNIDSLDWSLRDPDEIFEEVMGYKLDDGDVLLFHEIYDETAQAIDKIIPELINKGYQMVTISDMLKHEGIDINTLSYYYNLNPWPYYE